MSKKKCMFGIAGHVNATGFIIIFKLSCNVWGSSHFHYKEHLEAPYDFYLINFFKLCLQGIGTCANSSLINSNSLLKIVHVSVPQVFQIRVLTKCLKSIFLHLISASKWNHLFLLHKIFWFFACIFFYFNLEYADVTKTRQQIKLQVFLVLQFKLNPIACDVQKRYQDAAVYLLCYLKYLHIIN